MEINKNFIIVVLVVGIVVYGLVKLDRGLDTLIGINQSISGLEKSSKNLADNSLKLQIEINELVKAIQTTNEQVALQGNMIRTNQADLSSMYKDLLEQLMSTQQTLDSLIEATGSTNPKHKAILQSLKANLGK